MKVLIVGADKTPILEYLDRPYLLIDDGDIIDAVSVDPNHSVTVFDVSIHSFDPLKGITPNKARDLATAIYTASPQGHDTLTFRNGRRALTKLLHTAKRLDTITGNKKDPAIAEALGMIDDVLFSPVLKDVLNRPANMSFKGTIHARLNRAELGDFDCYLLANLLISQYQGLVVITDFGFYGHKGHTALIQQGRFVAGINFFAEVPDMRNELMLIDTKIPSHCTPDDAEDLAIYAGLIRDTKGYSDFIQTAIGG